MVRPLEYGTGIGLDEATERLGEIETAFEGVRARYSGFVGFFRGLSGKIDQADKRTLVDCIGVLLPLGLEPAVQAEVGDSSVFQRSADLNEEILLYLAGFKNTDVQTIPRY